MGVVTLDIDGVLANIASAFGPAAAVCGYSEKLDYSQYWFGIPLKLRLPIQRYLISSGFIEALPTYPDAVPTVEQLQKAGHRLICISARGFEGDDDLKETVERITWEWLTKNGFAIDELIFTLDKVKVAKQVGSNAMVEDSLEIASLFLGTDIRCYLIDRPWNGDLGERFGKDDYPWRLRSLAELPDLLF